MPKNTLDRKTHVNELVTMIAQTCNDLKAINLKALDVSQNFSLSDAFIIVSGRSDRHAQGIAYRLIELAESKSLELITIEGLEKAHWILLDFGNVVVHVFYEPIREHYNLEELWNECPEIKLDTDLKTKLQAA